jgi:hypothetical protein
VPDEDHGTVPIEEVLDRIPGALERARDGLDQARRREGIPLDALAAAPPQDAGEPAR